MNQRKGFLAPASRIAIAFGVAACSAVAHAQANACPYAPPPSSGPVAKAMQPLVDEHIMAGAVTVIATKDRVLDTEAFGYADVATKRPMAPEDIFWIASMSKPMTTTAFMMLVEEGKVSLDDLVQKYIPSFANVMVRPPKGLEPAPPSKPVHPITIREILSHNSGLTFSVPEEKRRRWICCRSAQRVDDYAKNPLAAQPGTEFIYANAGINTIGRIIEIVSGMPYDQFMQKRIFDPLGMTHTTFYPGPQQTACLPVSYKSNAAKDALEVVSITQLTLPFDDHAKRYPVPAGGLFSTAADCTTFIQMIANGGVYKGKRLVSEDSVRKLTTKQTSQQTKTFYGLGYSIINDKIGHNGAYKTDMFLMPKSGLITIFLVQQSGNWPRDGNSRVPKAFDSAVATFNRDAKPMTDEPLWRMDPPPAK